MKHSLTIALVDTLWDGHHPTYIKIMSRVLIENGYKVIVFCPCPEEISRWVFEELPSSMFDRIETYLLEEPPKINFPIRRLYKSVIGINRWRSLFNTVKEFERQKQIYCDLVFIAFLDIYLAPYLTSFIVDSLFPRKWSGLYFQPSHFRSPKKYHYLRHCFFDPSGVIHSSQCPVIAVLDEGIINKLNKAFNKPVITFPDFTDVSLACEPLNDELVNIIQTKSAGRKIIGLIGSLEKRKGILTLISVAKKMENENYFFVFAGKIQDRSFSNTEKQIINIAVESQSSNCFFHLSRISDEKRFNNLIQVCDVLFAAYEKFYGSSNILTKAAFFHKPVIVSKGFCMGDRVEKYAVGNCIEEGSIDECITSIRFLSDNNWKDKNNPDYEGLKKQHSLSKLNQNFQVLLNYI